MSETPTDTIEPAKEEAIILISSDNHSIVVPRQAAELSVLIRNIINDIGFEDDQIEIPIPDVKSAILEKTIEWCEHHRETKFADDDDNTAMAAPMDEWDRQFLKNVGMEIVCKLMISSNYLNIGPLLLTCCKFLAEAIRGKSPEEIREIFGIVGVVEPETSTEIVKT